MQLMDCCMFAGITYSDDKLLQTRVNAYADTQRYRLGVKCELAATPSAPARCLASTNGVSPSSSACC